jgi:hypothetical protein
MERSIENLLTDAKSGVLLTVHSRRRVISYLTELGVAPSNRSLARLFGVNESTVRHDLKKLRIER